MELKAVRTFVEVMGQGSFASVARQRDVDPSSISRSIAALERELGFPLLHRTTRRLSPTEAGTRYYERVRGLVDELERAGEEARDLVQGPVGTLRVTACTSFGERVLAPLLPSFTRKYPELTVDLLLADHQLDLLDEQVDLAIRFGLEPEGDFSTSMLVPRTFHVCASPFYLECNGHPETPQALRDRACLLFSTPGYGSVWKFRATDGGVLEVPVSGRLQVSHGMTMTACAVQGMGPALLPDWLCRAEIAAGTLIDLFPAFQCTATDFDTAAWLVYPSHRYRGAKVDAFVAHLTDHLRCG